MTTYYVRKTGSDAAAGTSPAAAWLTVAHAATQVTAGDTVYIGAGAYRSEVIVMSNSGTSANPILWYGDVDGSHTGDAGLVIITSRPSDADDMGSDTCLDLNGKKHHRFYDLIFAGAGNGDYVIQGNIGDSNYEGTHWERCLILGSIEKGCAAYFGYGQPDALSGGGVYGPTFQSCMMVGGVHRYYATAPAADVACGIRVHNCVVQTAMIDSSYAFQVDGPSSAAYGVSGMSFRANTVLVGRGYMLYAFDQFASGTVGSLYGNLVQPRSQPINLASDSGAWEGDYNAALGTVDTGSNYTSGGHETDDAMSVYGHALDGMLRSGLGFNPWLPFELVRDNGSGLESGGSDQGSSSYSESYDIMRRPLPMGRAADPGALGSATLPVRNSGVVPSGETYSLEFTGGAREQEFLVPLSASAHTISVQARYDSNYASSKGPELAVVTGPGGAGYSDNHPGPADTWDEISLDVTPSDDVVAVVKIASKDTSASGVCYFAKLRVT